MTTRTPITTDQMQYWMKTGSSAFTNVTEAVAFDPSTDLQTYDPTYKDRFNQPSFVIGKKTTIEFEIDLDKAGTLSAYLMDNEDGINVETEIIRVAMFDEVMTGTPAEGTGTYRAKKATFSMNQNPIDGPAGEVLRATGTLAMTSGDWTLGVFDPETATFTPDPE
jgi:hypothetical protein